ncbi:acyl-ACP--UDP-N-acetylglucosamine O-acyltransferase [Alkalitalea saponilacus]|uniref:Acyl-[acyl-carrier-protein]--UDP-N-acetylglucosamine O-acyltransferase n=1 Tax=Alkalitalea saponilacus TaxID=889453 RepID=A0A1T5APL2_9BACT|nr:acyl-ACP--UDP-N-acetylglucosamine O-acyltransferase [Alkalitalea saponilacus]ASB48630.1 acyl-[acyl-carrier-protein]--UDP-N-acetylglucosamine O-acyltransferase [Alkalitalea saponilacus]SKB37001.1 acyl-[acyl-carrier-protein]--UDP-N-acetylglucosamine O-acyltransferase [Alkalitalea saponilacus]
MEQLISPRAEIHPEAVIGKNVVVEAFAKIDKDVIIGDGTWIGANATIYPGARIGKECKIFPGAVIAAVPQDLKFKGEYSTVEIGDHTTIREYVTVNRGTSSKGYTKVGSHTLLMAYTHLGHDTEVGNHCVIANSVQIAGEVVVEDWAVVGGMSAIHQFCRVGAHAMVSGMSGVLSDVPPYTKVFGVPANYMGINYVGVKRRGFEKSQVDTIHTIYRTIYQSGMNTSQAIEHINMCMESSAEKDQIIEFIKQSKRGIIKSATRAANVTQEA